MVGSSLDYSRTKRNELGLMMGLKQMTLKEGGKVAQGDAQSQQLRNEFIN